MIKGWWIDCIVEAMYLLKGEAHLSELSDKVSEIRKKRGLSLPDNIKDFTATVRAYIEDYSSDSHRFKNKLDLFYSTRGLYKGYWGIREKYKFIQPFGEKQIERFTEKELLQRQDITFEDDIDNISISEDGKQLSTITEAKIRKLHYRYEGRLKSSEIKEIKQKKGYVCEACNMSFADRYPDIGEGFIECHHKIPYADIKEGEARYLNTDDFAVLCSNCHRMIHRLDNPADIDKLKEILLKGK